MTQIPKSDGPLHIPDHGVGRLSRIAGALAVVRDLPNPFIGGLVMIGEERIPAEIIRIDGRDSFVQVFEETWGLRVGDPAVDTGEPLSVTLGPGLLGSIYDGIQRPLDRLGELQGGFIKRGTAPEPIDMEKEWEFTPGVKPGDRVEPGDSVGWVMETPSLAHRIMVPWTWSNGGVIATVVSGKITGSSSAATLEDGRTVRVLQTHPVKVPLPCRRRIDPIEPFITGQRVLDFLFPMALGGSATIPGGFGTGKTVLEHSIAKHSMADVVVYIGCGERGNEMTDLLEEFAHLRDPRSGGLLLDRTILVANTSNMPVAAREASIYTGCALGEYYRQMGYHVAVIADSTTRWAEALREISGRLEELPGEEGFPTYLSSRIAAFYERSGAVECLGSQGRRGSMTVVGAVSPAGGDFSEPVTSETLKITGAFWGLEKELAHRRHFPAINWNVSYSLYRELLDPWFERELGPQWVNLREWAVDLLFREGELQQIVQLVGPDSLQERDRFTLDTAAMMRESFLQQSAYDERDAFCPPGRQLAMMRAIRACHEEMTRAAASVRGNRRPHEMSLDTPLRRAVQSLRELDAIQIEKILESEAGPGPASRDATALIAAPADSTDQAAFRETEE